MKNGNFGTNSNEKLSIFSSMSTKIAILISILVFIIVAVEVFIASNRASTAMQTTYLNYAQNLAEEAALGVDFATEFGEEAYGGYAKNLAQEAAVSIDFSRRFGESVYKSYAHNLAEEVAQSVSLASSAVSSLATGTENTEGANSENSLKFEAYNSILNDVTIKDVDGSYAYLVSPLGEMLWHPNSEKIGQPVENAAVKGIVEELKAGKKVENGSILYEYKGATKLAGYAFTDDGNILIVTADYNEFMKIDYDTLLGNIHIDGVDGSYAYMVSPTGEMLWHTNTEKIGQPVENAAVKGIVQDLKDGKKVEDGYVIYEYKGTIKLAGYSFTETGNIVLVTADYDKFIIIDYDKLIGGIEISGVSGSYAYMVSPDGTMLYHKTTEKIGQPVENAAVKGIVEDLKNGKKVPNGSCEYEYKGSYKVAGYAFTNSGNVVIVTADKDVMMASVDNMRHSLIIYGIICIIVAVILVSFFIILLVGSLKKLIPVINKTANYDFSTDRESDKLEKRSDEIGLIARALSKTRNNLRSIVATISDSGSSIDENVDKLKVTIDRVGQMCENNSDITEKLVAGMEETAATTSSITQNAESVRANAKSIEDKTNEGAVLSKEILSRAQELAITTEKASKTTIEIYEAVKIKSAEAINASKSVNKINELTNTINSISSQTSLLSLNASIEAARAGEAGRGFAIVASEISNLANQTSEAVSSISNIVKEVNNAVGQMSECLAQTTSFLEKNVLNDYRVFGKVSEQYKIDADTFGDSMLAIKESIKSLNADLENIVFSINDIDKAINEQSGGVSDIAEKTMDIVNETSGSSEEVEKCKDAVSGLNDIIQRFNL
ncbi:MAG: methyl-accepting chemotaxis protein [Lachnospiraceae bacterium]|nr:methyl-accepting chemotaxis protein [Lachnospiraceae bacterium]